MRETKGVWLSQAELPHVKLALPPKNRHSPPGFSVGQRQHDQMEQVRLYSGPSLSHPSPPTGGSTLARKSPGVWLAGSDGSRAQMAGSDTLPQGCLSILQWRPTRTSKTLNLSVSWVGVGGAIMGYENSCVQGRQRQRERENMCKVSPREDQCTEVGSRLGNPLLQLASL